MPTISVSEKEMEAILWFREKARNNLKSFNCEEMFKLHDKSFNRMNIKYANRRTYEIGVNARRYQKGKTENAID